MTTRWLSHPPSHPLPSVSPRPAPRGDGCWELSGRTDRQGVQGPDPLSDSTGRSTVCLHPGVSSLLDDKLWFPSACFPTITTPIGFLSLGNTSQVFQAVRSLQFH